jgi:hypothetical protein
MKSSPPRSQPLVWALKYPAGFLAVSIAWAACSSGTGQTGGADAAEVGLPDVQVEAAPDRAEARPEPTDLTASGDLLTDLPAHSCPLPAGPLLPPPAPSLIDDFVGPAASLNGRTLAQAGFIVAERFDATINARFSPAPYLDPRCGAAAAGAAHIAGMAADQGATLTLVFATVGQADDPSFFDASVMHGITFRAALGSAESEKTFSLRAGVAGSTWSYTKDIVIADNSWHSVDVLWSDLDRAPAAPAFDAGKLNQLVLTFISGTTVDIYLDDLAFLR